MSEFIIKDINGLVCDQEKIYMISPYIPIIMTYDFATRKVKKLCNYPQSMTGKLAFERIIKQGSRIYLFPCRTDSIYCYDMHTMEYINLLSLCDISDKVPARIFFEVLTYDGFIYAVSRLPQIVIRINPADNDVRIWKLEQEIFVPEGTELVDFSVCVYDDTLVYPYAADILIEFSIYEETFRVIHMEREQDDYDEKYRCLLGIAVDDVGRQWVFDWCGNVFEIIQNKMIKITLPSELNGLYDDGRYGEAPRINTLLAHEGILYFLLQSDNRILTYDIHKCISSWIDDVLTEWKSGRRKLAYTVYVQVNTDTYMLYNYNDGRIYIWNIKNGFRDQLELSMVLDDDSDGDWLKDYVLNQGDLELYIQYIKRSSHNKREENRKCFGQNIYLVLTDENMI